jgi:hypothetical protein
VEGVKEILPTVTAMLLPLITFSLERKKSGWNLFKAALQNGLKAAQK